VTKRSADFAIRRNIVLRHEILNFKVVNHFLLYILVFCIFPFFVLYRFYLRTSDAFINKIIVIVIVIVLLKYFIRIDLAMTVSVIKLC